MRINTQLLEGFVIVQERESTNGYTWLTIYHNDNVIVELLIREDKIVHLEMDYPTQINIQFVSSIVSYEKEICEWVEGE